MYKKVLTLILNLGMWIFGILGLTSLLGCLYSFKTANIKAWVISVSFIGMSAFCFLMKKKKESKNKEQERGIADPQKPVKMYYHVLIAFILFFVSAVVYDSIMLAMFSFVIAIIWVATRSKGKYTRKVKLLAIGIYILMFVTACVMKNVNDYVSDKNANVIIAACEQYKNKTGAYPAKLDDLVPGYLAEIPTARYAIMNYEFKYVVEEDNCILLKIALSPYERRVYYCRNK